MQEAQPRDVQPRDLQPTRDLGCSRDPVTRPKSDSKRVEHLLNKFSENTENSYLSRPGGDRRSSTSSTTSSGFQPRM